MKFQQLENALQTKKTLSVKNGLVHIGSDFLDKTLPQESLTSFYGPEGIEIASATAAAGGGPRKIIVKGTTLFPLLSVPTEVLAIFELIGDSEALALTLRYALPQGWRFLDSFPELPFASDYDSRQYSYDNPETVLDSFQLKRCCFYYTTYEHTLRDDDLGGNLSLEQGLTVAGRWSPQGMLGLFEQIAKSAGAGDKILSGPVTLSATGPLLPLEDSQLPWDIRPRIPGIHLQADLGFELSFPPNSDGGMKLKTLLFHLYSPLSLFPPAGIPEYDLAMAYAGDLFIPSIGKNKLATMSAARSVGHSDQLVIAGAFESLTLDNLASALKDLAGGDDSSGVLPQQVRDGISSLGLRNASITLLGSDNGYDVAQSHPAVWLALAWRLMPSRGRFLKV